MPTTTVARGCAWCRTCLRNPDRWGTETTDDDVDRGADIVVTLFHMATRALGRPDIYWQPATSEVIGDADGSHAGVDGGHPLLDLDALLEAVNEAAWAPFCEERTPTLVDMGDLGRFIETEEGGV